MLANLHSLAAEDIEAALTHYHDERPITVDTVRAHLDALETLGPRIEPSNGSASAFRRRYHLSAEASKGLASAAAHRRHTKQEITEGVVAHVAAHGRISNHDVRNLFNVGTPRASSILRELVDEVALVRTSHAKRGPTVEYGPGPLFEDLARKTSFSLREGGIEE